VEITSKVRVPYVQLITDAFRKSSTVVCTVSKAYMPVSYIMSKFMNQ
jgi:hypothetical protein